MISKRAILITITISATAIFFQNCGKVGFDSLNENPTLGTQGSTAIPDVAPPVVNPPDVNPPTVTNNDDNDAELVECDLGSSSAKVILNTNAPTESLAGDPSNAASTRVCMSKYACQTLVNAYAQAHNCSLAIGAVTTPNNASTCVQIFPGSQGTCNNAQILSDNAVESILASMKTD